MRWIVVLLVIGGCHKLFDLERVSDGGLDGEREDSGGTAEVDVLPIDGGPCPIMPFVFDEDGDSIDDRCDACPTVQSSPVPLDTDGDLLPDACDPDLGMNNDDEIELVATFAEQAELTAKFEQVNAVWSGQDGGTVTLTAPASIETQLMFTPTRIVIQFDGASASSLSSQLEVATPNLACQVRAANCAKTSPGATCVTMTPQLGGSPGEVGAGFGGMRRVVMEQPGNTLCQVQLASGGTNSSSQTAIGLGRVKISTDIDAVVRITSVTIYGSK